MSQQLHFVSLNGNRDWEKTETLTNLDSVLKPNILPPGRQEAGAPPSMCPYREPLLSQVRAGKIFSVCHRGMEWLLALVFQRMFVSSFIWDLDRLTGLKSRAGIDMCQYN